MQTFLITANIVKFSEIPPLFWVASLSGILCAVVLGFLCGYYYSNTEDSRALANAGKQIQKLVDLASLRLTQANQVCTELEKVTSGTLTEKDRDLLGRLQASISEKLTGFLQKHETAKQVVSEEPPEEVEPIEWEFETVDSVTLLPCAESMDNNLYQMIERSQKTSQTCGALLCRIDKYDNLKSRVGEKTIEHFRKKFSSLLIRSVTEMDLVCQMDESTFLILLPEGHCEESSDLLEQVIRAVRGYHFRSPENDHEFLVTASFGYTDCQSNDSQDTILGRIRNAVTQSERRGRNQLHIHNGTKSVHTLVS